MKEVIKGIMSLRREDFMGLIDINDICEKSRRQRAVALRNGSISGAMDVKLGRLSAFGRKGGIF